MSKPANDVANAPALGSPLQHHGELKWRKGKSTPSGSPIVANTSGKLTGPIATKGATPSDIRTSRLSFDEHLPAFLSKDSGSPVTSHETPDCTPAALSGNTRIQISMSPETSRVNSISRESGPSVLSSFWADKVLPKRPLNPSSADSALPSHLSTDCSFDSQLELAEVAEGEQTSTEKIYQNKISTLESLKGNKDSQVSPRRRMSPDRWGSRRASGSGSKSMSVSPDHIDAVFEASRQVSQLSAASGVTCASSEGQWTTDETVQRDVLITSATTGEQPMHLSIPRSRALPDSSILTPVVPCGTGGTVVSNSCLCQCPCRNCATCPLRVIHTKELKEAHLGKSGSSEPAHMTRCRYRSETMWSRVKASIIRFCKLEAEDDPVRYHYDSRVIPVQPLGRGTQRLLEITELPFLILWVYFTYWAVIVGMTAPSAPSTVWLSAAVAGILVGIGLNANAYKSVTVPRRRGSIRHHRHARALLELRKYGESIDSVEMKLDWGMIIRFFIIPFGVSSLSGLTNSNRDDFLLVFPNDPYYLMISILCPAVVVTLMIFLRLFLLWRLRVRWSLQVLFLNGALVD